jgi:plasmid rolling circle replication initiator protein Rep
MWRARFYTALPKALEDHPSLIPVFLTFTVRNCPVGELRSQVKQMNEAFGRLTKRASWPGVGWVKSLEVTRNEETGEAHPHFHVLAFVRPGYFSGQGYLNQAKWRELWGECLRVAYTPVVHVKRVKSEKKGDAEALRIAILETLKYSVKPEDLVADSEWLYGVTHQLHKMRAVAVGGTLKNYLREEEPEDLIHEEESVPEELETDSTNYLYFDWMTLVKRYAAAEVNSN